MALVGLATFLLAGALAVRAGSWLPAPAGAALPPGSGGELAAAAAVLPPPPPPRVPALPRGKGMWLHRLEWAAGGDPAALVAHAKAVGLTHVYLRLGSSKRGFYAQGDLDRLLPVAHAGDLAVVGWDFPYFFDPRADAERAAAEIAYTTPDGHRIDAFSADVETRAEGVNLTGPGAAAYGARLRELVGPGYPLIATIPPPPRTAYPFAEVTGHFDAIAPMVYWMNRDPVSDVVRAIDHLAAYGKPILPVGQAYDGGPEGGPPGPPPRDQLDRFMQAVVGKGAPGFSFWVWHTATAEHWAAIAAVRL
jgi:hypothetical protein